MAEARGLTTAQQTALERLGKMDGRGAATGINYRAGLALCRAGLAECLETHAIRAVFHSHHGSYEQFACSGGKAIVWREWYITKAGRLALAPHYSIMNKEAGHGR